ncbi:arginine--tRNA ligase [Candidatus Roizmanbacteria bacterium RIFOXYB2_FULL_41_10]|uniref:Arginine--tRNA ligase n=1 Tax=Candidatus Roizmanbacteria bacterium RIFOXYA1_FULL_41_12 TaxID=1802082 RepID=A0A1F7KEX4_9BACT|nr:MAG: arginine--tRNA ligase [Candidatus Roizmanbacteria bacterium RIFOXYA2_FULL_41_8]OGK66407.1 MAG: arginine--tRNA ligase [Candidatus Roizmanbacteria bacterium RIFOXYA1_FULL_41_12]OGK69292.1 MAG: arginine--tRNA ligase [Candidatus Roizmanbacteria bacterium RIFOXYB2_FULL_41_10]OGK74952.1 MAG: arginine--tRNA ligase [Candidatus Roizmanbacteria bacterium RIFOXYC2_FULL_41_10]OGK75318.1 MAG: arginine--tRNA ligase [Candidatus Roizmanbacteria bacterium RIFOXYD1_FULL_41_24]
MKKKISILLAKAVGQKWRSLIELTVSKNSEHGDFSSNLAMKLAGNLKQNPMTIAQDLAKKIKLPDYLKKIKIAKPGYLNFFLKEKVYLDNLEQILKDKDAFGQGKVYKGQRIMIEFAHPNPFKMMHIGHLRNITLGESLVRLFEAQGATVIRANYQGDVGMHVAKCVWAMNKVSQKSFPTETNDRVAFLGQCYFEGARVYEEDEKGKAEIMEINRKIYNRTDSQITKLWQLGVAWSLDKFHQLYSRVDSHFDREYMESETLPFIDQEIKTAIKKGILTKSQGALIFDGKKYGIDTRVYLTKEGLPTYEGKQLGLVVPMEFKDFGKLNKLIFNVAVEQISYFKSTIKVIELMHPQYKGIQYHNAYEFVGLKSGKMSSRKGQVVTAESILDEAHTHIKRIVTKNKAKLTEKEIDDIAVAAVKYAYLKISPFKYLAFDLKASISFSGDSGPYLQYTYARVMSILRKNNSVKKSTQIKINSEEKQLLQKLLQFNETIENAVMAYSPNYLATYLNDLAQLFNNFYSKHRVIGNLFRIKLAEGVAQVIKNGLYLLGIKTLEQM